jgi:heavy metal-(Cd/Co/Hg/Pb/Zn)-translocating P-type ATPase
MSAKQIKKLMQILSGTVAFAAVLLVLRLGGEPLERFEFALFLIPYLVVGWDVLLEAGVNIAHGQIFDENFLMAIATVGAFATREYPEAVFVMLFYQVGEWFQSYAVGKSRKSIASLMDIRPDYANVERDGCLTQVDPDEVSIGDVILVKAGEKIPLDGVVTEGQTAVDTSALTGESVPRDVKEGDEVISGCINKSGLIKVRVTKVFAESTVAKILDLVENSSAKKSKAENFITKFSRYYTPCVVVGAVLLAVLPPLIMGGNWSEWIHRALIFLVISCPCALVISVPLSFFGGIGGASRQGILIKGGNYLEALSGAETVVFDKTGTLTKGVFKVAEIHPADGLDTSKEQLLTLAAYTEHYSDHPISKSLSEAYGGEIDAQKISNVKEIPGFGVSADVQTADGVKNVAVGNAKFMASMGVTCGECPRNGTIAHVATDGAYAGHILIADEVKEDAATAVSELHAIGISRVVMLTGDSPEVGKETAQILGITEVHAGLLPADKVTQVETLLTQLKPKGKLVFVGDGINDAPVLSRADIGIAMGAIGSDAAIEAADIVLMDDTVSKIATAINISKKTIAIVKQNIIFALGIKFIVLILGALGIASMWMAVFADVGVSVIAILNAMRALGGRNA